MAQKSFRNYIRFVVLIFFLTTNSVGVIHTLLRMGSADGGKEPSVSVAAGLLVFCAFIFWFAIELWELYSADYNVHTRNRKTFLYLLRLAPFAAVFLVVPVSIHFLLPMAIIVATFYAAVYFDQKVAISILIIVLIAQFAADLLMVDPFRPKRPDDSTDIFFIIYQLMNTLLVWMIALFWRYDRTQWIKIHDLNDRLSRTQKRLKKYADQVADIVTLEERARMARDIHDSLGHNLTAATVQLNKAEGYLSRDPQTAKTALSEVRNCLQEGMKDIREVLSSATDSKGAFALFDQVRKLIQRLPDDGLNIETEFTGDETQFNKAVLLAAFRMIQEGITNALKHGQPGSIRISIHLDSDEARVLVADNGIGFSVPEYEKAQSDAGKHGSGTGITGLRNRIEVVRGILEVTSEPGFGTRLSARMPREPADLIEEGEE